MTEQAPHDPPRTHVEVDFLDDGDVLLVYNHPDVFRLVINASASPTEIAEALEEYFLQATAHGEIHIRTTSAIAQPVGSGSRA